MKIVESFNDLPSLDIEAKKIGYFKFRNKDHQQDILKLLPQGTSVWIDSNGVDINSNILAFENIKNKDILESKNIRYYKNIFSKTLYQAINKYIKPLSIVFYQSEEFKYISDGQLVDSINFLKECIPCKIIIHINTIFIDFNKLKYPITSIIEKIKKNTDPTCKVHNLDNFKYIFEIN